MTKELELALHNVELACEEYRGTKQEHLALARYLDLIKKNLLDPCTCKANKELNEIVNKH